MYTAYLAVTVITIAINVGISIADLSRARFVVANSTEVQVPLSWLPVLATLKLAGAAGLLVGMLVSRPLGVAAAVGLVLFYTGALTAHTRARVFYNMAFPGTYWAFAVASLVLVLTY